MPTEMEGLSQQADQLGRQSQGLRAAVDSGQLVMDPQSAKDVAKIYEEKADEILFEIQDSDRLIARGAYGDCYIGNEMDSKMTAKMEDPDSGTVPLLRKMEQILRKMSKAFEDSAREMTDRDEDNARALNRQDV